MTYNEIQQTYYAPKIRERTLHINPPRIAPDIWNLKHRLLATKASWSAKAQLLSRRFQKPSFSHEEMYGKYPSSTPCSSPRI